METTEKLNGIIGVVNTPFTPDDHVDTGSLGKYVRHSLACGVVGFLTTAMAAEVDKLSTEERLTITRTIVDEVQGRVPVIGGTSAASLPDILALVRLYTEAGCDGILVYIPYENEKKYRKEIEQIASHVNGFLMIQDWDFEGSGIPVAVIVKLFEEIEVFKCLKVEVKPAGVKYTRVIEATGGKLHVSGGWAGTQMIEALDRGVNAFMPTILHDVYDLIFRLHHAGRRKEAIDWFNRLLPVIAFSHQHVDISVHFNKRIMYKSGIFSTPLVRNPILPFDKYHEKIADELISYAMNLSSEIKNKK